MSVGCRICKTRIEIDQQTPNGVYKCKCKEVSVRVFYPVTLVNELTKGASVIIASGELKSIITGDKVHNN